MWLKALLTTAIMAAALGQAEPVHEGKPLSHWIQSCFHSTDAKAIKQGEDAILKIGAPAVPSLLVVLRDRGNPPLRTTVASRALAASILGRIGPSARDALPALREAAKDSDFLVRASATDAIKMIEAKKED